MRILLLDNIDSFTWNIFHYLEVLGEEVRVLDNRSVLQRDIDLCDALVISPGPGLPSQAGRMPEMLDYAIKKQIPVLGVCLGMQAIAEYFGGTIFNQREVKHGQSVLLKRNGNSRLLSGLPETWQVGLYHSWAVAAALPAGLRATAFSEEGIMMALEHSKWPVFGVQFHPESILSEYGMEVFANFLSVAGKSKQE